jgi:probable H4MPT-linked C1 transfer pathway protein
MPQKEAWHAVTMTGELVDLFEHRGQGVLTLVDMMRRHTACGRLWIYAGQAGFLEPDQAVQQYDRVASANWFATVSMAAAEIPSGVLIDIGSTTTDIIPFGEGRVSARGMTDYDRLRYDELVYTGVVRTPVMALVDRVPFQGAWITPMAEHFATAADVYRLAQMLPMQADQTPSADRRGKGDMDSARRLARMLGRDAETADITDWRRLAIYVAEHQLQRIRESCECVLSRGLLAATDPLIGAGVGRFLVSELANRLGRPYQDFNELFTVRDSEFRDMISICAPAVAVARLALGAGGDTEPIQ